MLTRIHMIVQRFTFHRSTRLTSEGLQFLFFTMAVGIAAINTGNNLFYLLLSMMLSIILVSGIAAEYCLRRLEFHRHLPDLLFANELATATLVIKNRKSRFPSFSLRVLDVCDGQDIDRGLVIRELRPGASMLLSYPLVVARRGRLRLDGIRVVTSFPFGLFLKRSYYPIKGEAVVCPEIKPLADDVLRDVLAAGQEHTAHRKGFGSDLYNLRVYQAGDDSRAIHWVTTARTSKLTVRETEAESQRRASIYLSLLAPDSHDTEFEEAVAYTVSLVHLLAVRGYHLQLTIGSSRSPVGQGEAHLLDLLRMLALCERHAPHADMRATTDQFTEPQGTDDGGALIVVRPWRGSEVPSPAVPALVVDTETFLGASHVM